MQPGARPARPARHVEAKHETPSENVSFPNGHCRAKSIWARLKVSCTISACILLFKVNLLSSCLFFYVSHSLSLSLPLSLSRFSWTIILSATICEGCSATEKAQSASLRMCRKEVVFLLRSCHLNPSEATSVLSSAEHAMPCLPNCSGAIFREPI